MSSNDLIVKNSRVMIGFLISIGLLFVVVGLSILIAYMAGTFHIDPTIVWRLYAFEFFAVGIGGVIVASQIMNFISPFVMLRTDDLGIYFGTGWRYRPYFIPWALVKTATIGDTGSMPFLVVLKNCDCVSISFTESTEIPASMATSAGIMYGGYTLTLDGSYIDIPASTIVEFINNHQK